MIYLMIIHSLLSQLIECSLISFINANKTCKSFRKTLSIDSCSDVHSDEADTGKQGSHRRLHSRGAAALQFCRRGSSPDISVRAGLTQERTEADPGGVGLQEHLFLPLCQPGESFISDKPALQPGFQRHIIQLMI